MRITDDPGAPHRASTSRNRLSHPLLRACLLAAACTVFASPGVHAERTIPLLKAINGTYTNVLVVMQSDTEIHIRHDGGVRNVPLDYLTPESLALLGLERKKEEPRPATPLADTTSRQAEQILAAFAPQGNAEGARLSTLDAAQLLRANVGIIRKLLLLLLVLHLLLSFCCYLIVRKTGNRPGILVWLPFLQMIPLLRAAGMSGWWILGYCVPVLNLVVAVMWCFRIVNARGKHVIWAVFLLLPFTSIVSFLYLAFSSDGSSEQPSGAMAAA